MKRKTTVSSDEDSNVSEEVELESSDEEEEQIAGDVSDQGSGPDDEDLQIGLSEDMESVQSMESEVSKHEGVEFNSIDKMRDEDGDEVSAVSADDQSDDDSVSLNSMDTVEAENTARVKKEQAEAVRNRDFSSLYLPVGGIFDHKLIRGLPVDSDEYKRQQQAFYNGETAAERTTTRNTPANVIEALDQELRFARPPVTTDILVAKYNVIKLVIKRRIDHLRSRGLTTPGIRYDHFLSTANYEEGTSRNTDTSDKLLYDIQFRNPPMTVKDMSVLYNMSVHALHAKIYALRNKGVVTNGICASTNGRGRPRKAESETMEEAEANLNTSYHNNATNNAHTGRVLRYFTEEEDEYLTCHVLQCLEWNRDVSWGVLDSNMNRSRGATKQRWHKTLERRLGGQIQDSLRKGLRTIYNSQSRLHLEDDDDLSEMGIQSSVKDTLNCVVSAVNEFSNKFPHHIVTLPLSYPTNNPTLSTAPTSANTTVIPSYSKSSRAIIPTPAALQQHLHTTNHSGQRRAFTEQEDNLIICTALHNRQLGVGRFWNALDEQLQRPKLAARGRWQRVLEPIVQGRIAMMAEIKSEAISAAADNGERVGSGVIDTSADVMAGTGTRFSEDSSESAEGYDSLKADSKADRNLDSSSPDDVPVKSEELGDSGEAMDVVEQPVEPTVVVSIPLERDTSPSAIYATDINPFDASTTTIKTEPDTNFGTNEVYDSHTYALRISTSNSKPFTSAEDDLVRATVKDWVDTGNRLHELGWRQLDAQLQRPNFSALVRYITVLQPQPTTSHRSNNGHTSRKQNGEALGTTKPPVSSLLSLYNTFRTAYKTPTSSCAADEVRLEVKTTVDCVIMAIMQITPGKRPPAAHIPKKMFVNAGEKDEVNHNRCKRFSPEEDEFVKTWIEDAKAAGKSINWSELDKALNRSTGATRQRWKKVLGNEY